ncbi:pilus assembly protein N-terminal domain-containing protein [bacterium]|nr:pilus assembly protein N-terminal domain-containing protein [candidate division CSSED10-310 bacterium]
MKRTLFVSLTLLAVLLGATLAALAQEDAVTILIGEQKSIDVRNVRRVAVGDPNVADVKVISESEMLLTGINTGSTTLTIWDSAGGKSVLRVVVVARDPRQIKREVEDLLTDVEGVQVKVVGDRVVLDGEVFREKDLKRAQMVEAMYPKQVILLLEYNKAYIQMKRMIQIEFKFYEIEKTALTKLGVNWNQLLNPAANLVTVDYTLPLNMRKSQTPGEINDDAEEDPYGTVRVGVNFNPLKLNQDTNRNRLLAEHQAIVRSGEALDFLIGGEYPIVIEGGVGSAGAVEYKEYGTSIKSTPEIDKINNVLMPLELESSELDWSNSVQGYPALKVNRSKTTINLKAGQTMLIGGIFNKSYAKALDGLPGFSRIPIIGYLFGSKEFQNGRTDGVLFITPTIINPVDDASQSPRIQAVIDIFEQIDLKI